MIYRILKAILAAEKAEEWDEKRLLPEALKTTEENRDRLTLKLCDAGYITGLHIIRDVDDLEKPVILWQKSRPTLTIAGLEYLENNGMMQKVKAIAKGIIETVK